MVEDVEYYEWPIVYLLFHQWKKYLDGALTCGVTIQSKLLLNSIHENAKNPVA